MISTIVTMIQCRMTEERYEGLGRLVLLWMCDVKFYILSLSRIFRNKARQAFGGISCYLCPTVGVPAQKLVLCCTDFAVVVRYADVDEARWRLCISVEFSRSASCQNSWEAGLNSHQHTTSKYFVDYAADRVRNWSVLAVRTILSQSDSCKHHNGTTYNLEGKYQDFSQPLFVHSCCCMFSFSHETSTFDDFISVKMPIETALLFTCDPHMIIVLDSQQENAHNAAPNKSDALLPDNPSQHPHYQQTGRDRSAATEATSPE